MKTYTIELKKTVVVTIEADSFEGAKAALAELEDDGELGESWGDAEATPVLIHVGEP